MTIQLYILRQLLVSVAFSISGIAIIVLPAIAIQAIHKLGSVGLMALLRYLPLVVVNLVPFLLPMAFLLGVVVTYGRLAAERELVAIRMAAVHPARLALPALLVALPLSLGTSYLLSSAGPAMKYEQRTYLRKVDKEAFQTLAQGRTALEFGRSSLVALEREGNVFLDVLLDLELDDDDRRTVMADAVELTIDEDAGRLQLEFENAHVLGDQMRMFDQFPFCNFSIDELFPYEVPNRRRGKYLSSSEIRHLLATEEHHEDFERDLEFELHSRYALSGSYLLFLLLGIPTGILLRSSTQLGAITGASGYAFLYYALALQLGAGMAKSGVAPAWLAAWAADALFAAVGLVLIYRSLCK